MTRLLLLTPFLAACVHTPTPCVPQWPYTCEDRGDGVRAVDVSPPAPVDDSNGADSADKPADPKDDHSRDDNGDSSDDNGASSDENGGKS